MCSFCDKEEWYGHIAFRKACKSCFDKGIGVLLWGEKEEDPRCPTCDSQLVDLPDGVDTPICPHCGA